MLSCSPPPDPPSSMTLPAFAMTLGVMCYLIGFPLIFSEKKAVAWIKKWCKDAVTIRAAGAILTVLSLLVLKMNWRLMWDAEGLIVFLAWLTLVKGVFLAWWPDVPSKILMNFLSPATAMLLGFALLVWGALLTFLGFILV